MGSRAQNPRQFSTRISRANNTVYQALTDGIVSARNTAGGQVNCKTDASNPPTTSLEINTADGAGVGVPVIRGDYWKIEATGGTPTVFWTPEI